MVLPKNIVFLVFCISFCLNVNGQNLVPNPSFEDSLSCPLFIGDFSVANWISPTPASPDYFHVCNQSNVSVPQNAFGWQNPKTGNAYVGGHTSDFISSSQYREYIQCQLTETLEAGSYYEVSFFTSRTDSSTKACNYLGALLSENQISSNTGAYLQFQPQILRVPNVPIIEADNWVQIIDTIVALGGEEYLTIGVFQNNENIDWVEVTGGWEVEAHYYYDDVSVQEVFPSSTFDLEETVLNVYPIPSTGIFNINSKSNIEVYQIYSSLGKLLKESVVKKNSFSIDLTNFPPGIYFLISKTKNKHQTTKLITQ